VNGAGPVVNHAAGLIWKRERIDEKENGGNDEDESPGDRIALLAFRLLSPSAPAIEDLRDVFIEHGAKTLSREL
jgi:hypothetical protein